MLWVEAEVLSCCSKSVCSALLPVQRFQHRGIPLLSPALSPLSVPLPAPSTTTWLHFCPSQLPSLLISVSF